jgi:hypothetical protein
LLHKQQAKFWERRAAMSMARLWRDQGKRKEARDLLAPVYGWFTERFDTRDIKEAKVLLDELAVLWPGAGHRRADRRRRSGASIRACPSAASRRRGPSRRRTLVIATTAAWQLENVGLPKCCCRHFSSCE